MFKRIALRCQKILKISSLIREGLIPPVAIAHNQFRQQLSRNHDKFARLWSFVRI